MSAGLVLKIFIKRLASIYKNTYLERISWLLNLFTLAGNSFGIFCRIKVYCLRK